jgi:hypothetical protein
MTLRETLGLARITIGPWHSNECSHGFCAVFELKLSNGDDDDECRDYSTSERKAARLFLGQTVIFLRGAVLLLASSSAAENDGETE